MKKRLKIILSILLPIICITSVCLSFLLVNKKSSDGKLIETEVVETDTRRFQANYYANADEISPAQGQSASYKGGGVFLEPEAVFIMLGGTLQNHSNTFGGAVYISSGATFTMEGGTITGCSATYGGAIYVEAGGTCNIEAGTITGNSANYGPSIYAESGAIVNISDDTIIDENSVELNYNVSISTDTIAVGNPSANFNLHYIDFGSYPQWYVGSSMNVTLENWYSNGGLTSLQYQYTLASGTWSIYKYTDGELYARGTDNNVQNGTGTFLNGEAITTTGGIGWFKVEPLRWVVLNYDEYINGNTQNLELMSYFVLNADLRLFIGSTYGWFVSPVRTWLNDEFYNKTFNEKEKEFILTTTVKNNVVGNYNSSTSNDKGQETQDKVYLLSYWDFYDSNGIFANNAARMLATATDFAVCNKTFKWPKNANSSLVYPTATFPNGGGTCAYMTRSYGNMSTMYCGVGYDGNLFNNGGFVNDSLYMSVRPVIQIKI